MGVSLHPLLEGEGGRVENFGKKTPLGGHLGEKNAIINRFLGLPKLWELRVFPPALLWVGGILLGAENQGNSITSGEGDPVEQTQRLSGGTSGKGLGFFSPHLCTSED